MPNLPPRGIFARLPGSAGPSSVPVEIHATLPSSVVPLLVREIWAAGVDRVPYLVWTTGATAPTGVSATYINGGTVNVAWSIPAPSAVDSWEVKRPDGTIVGYAAPAATSLVDTDPRPTSGTYTVRGKLGVEFSSPAASATVNYTAGPGSVTASAAASVTLTWTHPGFGQPTQYKINRNSSFLQTVSGTTLVIYDGTPISGTSYTYTVQAVIAGDDGGVGTSNTVSVAAREPTNVRMFNPGGGNAPGHKIKWDNPGGTITGFEIQEFISSWLFLATKNSWDTFHSWGPSVHTVSSRVRSLSPGGNSAWVQAGPHAPG